jgi:hypothetical protein
VPWLRRLVAGFPPLRPVFDPRSGHVGFMVDNMTRAQVFPYYLVLPCQFFITPTAPCSLISLSPALYGFDAGSVVK